MDRKGGEGPLTSLADYAGPIRWIGNGICGFALFVLVAGTIAMLTSDEGFDFTIVVITGVFFAIGLLFRFGANKLAGGDGPEMPVVFSWVFMAAGGAMVVGGIVLVIDDPAGFALMGFGAVFLAAGWFARKLFATPAGKKAVFVQAHEADIRTYDGRTGTRRGGTVIHVDEDADAAEIDAARAAWLEARRAERPDWVAGRVEAMDQRQGGLIYVGAALWVVFAAAAFGAALIWGDVAWIVAPIAGVVALAIVGFAVRTWLHRRKYAASHCVLAGTPLYLGQPFEAEIESGIAKSASPRDGFTVELRCVHRWEETRGVGSERRSRRRADVLWRGEARSMGKHSARHDRVLVPVAFTPPEDQPAATLGGVEGIYWELRVRAEMPGLDYESAFELPVMAPVGTGC